MVRRGARMASVVCCATQATTVQWAVGSGQGPRELHLGVVVAETPEHGKDVLGGRAGASRSEDHPFAAAR